MSNINSENSDAKYSAKSFGNELGLINSSEIRELAKECLEKAPDYFYTMPASTTGKYHPDYALGNGGLVRHVKAAVAIAESLLQLEQNNHLPHDEIICALILHDLIKKGSSSNYTVHEHPLLASNFVEKTYNSLTNIFKIPANSLNIILNCIDCHMGEWNTNKNSNVVLLKPENEEEKFVHMCDFLASRKFIEVSVV